MIFNADWITAGADIKDVCPVFCKRWKTEKKIVKAKLSLTALGTYEARLNGKRISDYVLAPGWTTYEKRLQYQCYDVTDYMDHSNELTVTVGKGWCRSRMVGWMDTPKKFERMEQPAGILGALEIEFEDGCQELIYTDASWEWAESKVRFSEIYDGEVYDASIEVNNWQPVQLLDWSKEILIPQEGEVIREMERVAAKEIIVTPIGEVVVDFGQNITGYVEFTVDAKAGDRIYMQHGEVLDKQGNFYNENYRSADPQLTYICKDGVQTWHPLLTFYGFRYIKLVDFPGEAKPEQFTAVVVYSDMKRIGHLNSSSAKLNQLFSNIFWGQKGNFLDVPTDCPQRDERLGWTGDAQVFVKAASYNYDIDKFFVKWLHDMKADQRDNGAIGQVIPDYLEIQPPSAAWGDAVVICPWQMYLTYGNKAILEEMFENMTRWIDYITSATNDEYLWTGGEHFEDWLGLDAPSGSYKGSTRADFIASAYYAYSTELVIKIGKLLGREVAAYEELYQNIVTTFRSTFTDYRTQTEHILAVRFHLAENLQETADALAALVKKDGVQIRTGFVGTPYILHVLSEYGYSDMAYSLLLREEYPSWLYSVNKGATTIWEHWDGIMENGEFWSTDMNSFNHYSYGSVADWVYEKAAGIQVLEEYPGFEKVRIAPHPDERLQWLEASIETRHGLVSSKWMYEGDRIRYDIVVDMPAEIIINEQIHEVGPGVYTYWK